MRLTSPHAKAGTASPALPLTGGGIKWWIEVWQEKQNAAQK